MFDTSELEQFRLLGDHPIADRFCAWLVWQHFEPESAARAAKQVQRLLEMPDTSPRFREAAAYNAMGLCAGAWWRLGNRGADWPHRAAAIATAAIEAGEHPLILRTPLEMLVEAGALDEARETLARAERIVERQNRSPASDQAPADEDWRALRAICAQGAQGQ